MNTQLRVGASLLAFGLLWLPSLSPHYGFYSDELYYLACAERLDFGYVDHPPLFVWLLRLHAEVFGDSLPALRALPALAGATLVWLTGHMTQRLGGGLYAQGLAMGALMAGQWLALFSIFTVNCIALFAWALASWFTIELCRSRDPRWLVGLGAVLGAGFLAKHSVVVFAVALVAGLLLAGRWRLLASRWSAVGALLFSTLALPNLLWQWSHEWPSLAFYRLRAEGGSLTPLEVVGQQIEFNNPFALPVWIAGVLFFFLSGAGRNFRPLGWAFAIVFGLAMLAGQPTPYRTLGAFPVALAGGGVLLASLRRPGAGRLRRIWDTWTLPTLLLAGGGAAASLILPVLPPETLMRHPLWDGSDGWPESTGGGRRLPYHLGNRIHWQEYTDLVREVVAGLPAQARGRTILLTDYFGHAGALERYGRDLPPVYSHHTGYALWGPPPASATGAVVSGIDPALLRSEFESVRVAAVFACELCPGWLDGMPIHVVVGARKPWPEIWRELQEAGGMQRHRRLLRPRPPAESTPRTP